MKILDTVTAVQDQILDTVKLGDGTALAAAHAVADILEPVTARVPEIGLAEQLPKPAELIEVWYRFGEKLLAEQKHFALELASVLAPRSATKPTRPKGTGTKAA